MKIVQNFYNRSLNFVSCDLFLNLDMGLGPRRNGNDNNGGVGGPTTNGGPQQPGQQQSQPQSNNLNGTNSSSAATSAPPAGVVPQNSATVGHMLAENVVESVLGVQKHNSGNIEQAMQRLNINKPGVCVHS